MPFNRDRTKEKVAALAAKSVYVGTSSWKYESWLGQLYTASRYSYKSKAAKFQGKVSSDRFEADCLSEYAEVFKTVCVDAAYYRFPPVEYLQGMADQVPDDFRFGFKVTDDITVKRFPNHPRHGAKAGQPNPDFLNADLFSTAFLKPCEAIRAKVGVLMFEFSKFYPTDYEHGRDFVADLDTFLGNLPKGWPYAIEMRNKHWLRDEYFGCLTRHGVTHVFNSWDAMPPVSEQMALPGSRTNPRLIAARFLVKPGRKYEEAVKMFQPITYPHPSLEPVLRDAFGLVVYEEHILQICEAFAGLNPGRADVLRRALNKQKRAAIAEIQKEFFASARARGHATEKIQEVWELVAGFAGYAFCKAHSTAYGVEAFQAAWLKRNYPAEFMAAVLTNGKGFYDPLVYVLESYRLGLKFLPPSVNEPGPAFPHTRFALQMEMNSSLPCAGTARENVTRSFHNLL